MIYDGCIGPKWHPAFIGDPTADPVYNLSVRIFVSDDPYKLYFSKMTYEKRIQSPGNECGDVLYSADLPTKIVTLLDDSQENFIIDAGTGFIIYLAACCNEDIGLKELTFSMRLQAID